jgi:hypothetical protein
MAPGDSVRFVLAEIAGVMDYHQVIAGDPDGHFPDSTIAAIRRNAENARDAGRMGIRRHVDGMPLAADAPEPPPAPDTDAVNASFGIENAAIAVTWDDSPEHASITDGSGGVFYDGRTDLDGYRIYRSTTSSTSPIQSLRCSEGPHGRWSQISRGHPSRSSGTPSSGAIAWSTRRSSSADAMATTSQHIGRTPERGRRPMAPWSPIWGTLRAEAITYAADGRGCGTGCIARHLRRAESVRLWRSRFALSGSTIPIRSNSAIFLSGPPSASTRSRAISSARSITVRMRAATCSAARPGTRRVTPVCW